jgi:nucleoside 2-deoxyribosyltransferase
MMTKIFVSHSRRDSVIAKKIAHAIQKVGSRPVTVFLDQNIKPGDDFREVIDANLRSSDAVLVVAASPDAVSNSWVGYEIGAAEALRKPVMLLTSNRHSRSELPEDLGSLPVVVFDPEAPEGAAKEIVGRLSSYSSRE